MSTDKSTTLTGDQSTAALLAQVEAEQARLRKILSAGDAARFTERPPSGKWSVVENVRHLIFAEQAHLGQFVAGARDWSPFGYTPATMLRARKLNVDQPAPSLPEVLDAWAVIHASIRAVLATTDREAVRIALWKNLTHLRAHIAVIERLIRNTHRIQTSSEIASDDG